MSLRSETFEVAIEGIREPLIAVSNEYGDVVFMANDRRYMVIVDTAEVQEPVVIERLRVQVRKVVPIMPPEGPRSSSAQIGNITIEILNGALRLENGLWLKGGAS